MSFKFNLLSLPTLTLGNSQKGRMALPFSALHSALCALFSSTIINDSHYYSPRCSRLGARALNKSDALSSSALHSALRASFCSSE
jgi:hypothetical protein